MGLSPWLPSCFSPPRCGALSGRPPRDDPSVFKMILVQISDPHIRRPGKLAYQKVDTAAALSRVIQCIEQLPQPADAVVVTGDLVDFGLAEEYAHLRTLLAPLSAPVFLLAGNHDKRDVLRGAFSDHHYLPATGRLCYAVDVGPLRLVALDSTVPGHSHGSLDAAQLDWLDTELALAPERPTVVALHHPPFTTLIGHMDQVGLREGIAGLEDIVRRHPQVERVISGHLHRAIDRRFGGSIASTCPGTSHQVCLDLAPNALSRFVMEPPAFRVHAWTEPSGLVSHLMPVGQFDGPFPFYDENGLID